MATTETTPAVSAVAESKTPQETSNVPVQQPAKTALQQESNVSPKEHVTTGKEDQIPSQTTTSAKWPELDEDHPLSKFSAKLGALLTEADYNEVYGLKLVNPPDFHTHLILQKFLRANANDIDKAHTQLLEALKWRKEFRPLETLNESFSRERFGGLGYIVTLKDVPDSTNASEVATFNLYGAVKDPKHTFEDIDGFMRWRVNLMELSLQKLNLTSATEAIPDYGKGPDPYQAIQIHDYMQVSFLKQNPYTKAASNKAIEVFKNFYPETLSRKFFINVPVLMGWMFTAVSLVLSRETVKKFTVLSYGNTLNTILGDQVPAVYGGKGPALEDSGSSPKLVE